MDYRTLGRTGAKISPLCLGAPVTMATFPLNVTDSTLSFQRHLEFRTDRKIYRGTFVFVRRRCRNFGRLPSEHFFWGYLYICKCTYNNPA
jgi:hypothetical protein